ncbi:hypothetical protein PENTCL1PPCAC_10945, partial [Pristionchus entomophagus]
EIFDDYLKEIRQCHEQSGKNVRDIQIPVSEALYCDPFFIFVVSPEKQIVNEVREYLLQWVEITPKEIQEATTRLCMKLAEQRVFGPALIGQSTVGASHLSTYNNLPDEGIIYIQEVARREMKKWMNEEEFETVFTRAMRKLADRCRQIRRNKKKESVEEANRNIIRPRNELPCPI